MSLAITGATGFVGRHLLSACSARGYKDIRVLTRSREALGLPTLAGLTICEGDLLQPETLSRFLSQSPTVIHLAYLHRGKKANLTAANNLANAAIRSGVRRVVHCSTAVVVGSHARGLVTETNAEAPTDPYQETKYDIEETLRTALQSRVELAILRPTEIVGPGGAGLRRLIKRLRERSWYANRVYHTVLKHRRFNYIAVQNVVAALLLLAESPVPQQGDVYQVSDDDDSDNSYAAVEAIVNAHFAKRQPRWDVGLPPQLLALLLRCLSTTPVSRFYSRDKIDKLGYRKSVTLREAIQDILVFEDSERSRHERTAS